MFSLDEMVKKRVIKKRVQKRKVVKKNDNKKDVPDTTKMSRLEYEQSMMDPRFRAAMMGFNNPPLGLAQQNHLREVETKNNELANKITILQELDEQKKRNLKLKSDLLAQKEKSDYEINQLKQQHQMQHMQHEYIRQQEMTAYQMETLRHNNEFNMLKEAKAAEIQKQKNINEIQKRKYQEEMQKIEAENKLQLLQQQEKFNKQANDYQAQINEIENKNKIKQAKFNNNQELLDKQSELIKKQMEEVVQPAVNEMKTNINEINRNLSLNQELFNDKQRILDTTKELMIAEFKETIEPEIQKMTERINDIKNGQELAKEQYQSLKELTQLSHEEQIPLIRNANLERSQELNTHLQQLRNEFALNQEKYDERDKQDKVKQEIAKMEQKTNKQTREKYSKELLSEAKKTAKAEKTRDLARGVEEVRKRGEEADSETITLAAPLFKNIKLSDIQSDGFNDKLAKKKAELLEEQKKRSLQIAELKALSQKQNKIDAALEQGIENTKAYMNGNQYIRDVAKRMGITDPKEQFARLKEIHETANNMISENIEALRNIPTRTGDDTLDGRLMTLTDDLDAFGYDVKEQREALDNNIAQLKKDKAATDKALKIEQDKRVQTNILLMNLVKNQDIEKEVFNSWAVENGVKQSLLNEMYPFYPQETNEEEV